mmetsp:Transcript_11528/g.25610  ORF Transcript_11528/g.25610 Transcript_11528/m.25610 type:complete len:206 (+) Transcript_11528:2686-3303(+)
MILRYMKRVFSMGLCWSDVTLWKVDTLLDYFYKDSRLFTSELSGGKVFIYTAGCFSFAGQPAAFDVVTRALRHELPRTLKDEGDGYVDDFYGLGLDAEIPEDMRSIMALIRQLLGDKAIAEDKSAFGKRLEIIGWLFDLLQQLVTIGQRCLDKALHGFMAVNEFKPIKLKELQRMASWGVRYGTINCLMQWSIWRLQSRTRDPRK